MILPHANAVLRVHTWFRGYIARYLAEPAKIVAKKPNPGFGTLGAKQSATIGYVTPLRHAQGPGLQLPGRD